MHSQVPEQVAELFSVRLAAADMPQFVAESEEVDRYFSDLEGYSGIEVLILSEVEVLVIIRWQGYTLFDQHLPRILHACPVKVWLRAAVSATHRPAICLPTAHHPHTTG